MLGDLDAGNIGALLTLHVWSNAQVTDHFGRPALDGERYFIVELHRPSGKALCWDNTSYLL